MDCGLRLGAGASYDEWTEDYRVYANKAQSHFIAKSSYCNLLQRFAKSSSQNISHPRLNWFPRTCSCFTSARGQTRTNPSPRKYLPSGSPLTSSYATDMMTIGKQHRKHNRMQMGAGPKSWVSIAEMWTLKPWICSQELPTHPASYHYALLFSRLVIITNRPNPQLAMLLMLFRLQFLICKLSFDELLGGWALFRAAWMLTLLP